MSLSDTLASNRCGRAIALIALSTPVRLAADAFPDNYAEWLGASGELWVLGVAIWGLVFLPKMLPHHVAPD